MGAKEEMATQLDAPWPRDISMNSWAKMMEFFNIAVIQRHCLESKHGYVAVRRGEPILLGEKMERVDRHVTG